MMIVVAVLKAKPGREADLEKTLRILVNGVKSEKGALEYTLHHVENNPGTYLFYEKYADKGSFALHTETPHFKRASEEFKTLLDGEALLYLCDEVDSIKQ